MQKVRQRFHSDGFTFLGFTYVVSEFESLPVFMVFNGSLIEILRPTIKLNQLLFLLQQPFNRMNWIPVGWLRIIVSATLNILNVFSTTKDRF